MNLLSKALSFSVLLSFFIVGTSPADVGVVEAKFDFQRQEFAFKFQPQARGNLSVEGAFSPCDTFGVHFKFNHLLLGKSDILGDIKIKGKILKDPSGRVRALMGRAWAYNFLINYSPFRKALLSFAISDSRLKIISGVLGPELELSGTIGLAKGYPIDLAFEIKDMDLVELAGLFGFQEGFLSGKASGRLILRGPLFNPMMEANIVASNGNLADIQYSHAQFYLSGEGSLVQIVDSRLYIPGGGFYTLDGEIDLSGQKKPTGFDEFKIDVGGETFSWEDWRISRDSSGPGLSMRKDVGEEFAVGLKASFDDEITARRRATEEVELEYKLKGAQSLKMYMRKDEELLSLEHKLEF